MRYGWFSLYLVMLLTCSFGIVNAQYEVTPQEIGTWYLEERFIIADINDDAYLDRGELQRFSKEFAYYLEDQHYRLTDANRDGLLSFNEIYSRIRAEFAFRTNLEKSQIAQLRRRYPELNTVSFLKNNPAIVTSLFGNLVWMAQNNQLVEDILREASFISENPDVLISLHQNLRWMVAHPLKAKNLYKNRYATQRLPELLGWRADHKDFMRKHTLIGTFYELDFIPEGFQED